MILFEWTKSVEVGIKEIDNQHKKLFGYMNELYDALEQRKEREILQRLFKDLEEYTDTHFSFEEEHFKEFNYPKGKEHTQGHKVFIKKLEQIKSQISKDTIDTEDLLELLVEWFMHHIKEIDHQYVACFHEHGL
ncbi:MAG: bacteriohemerythrin [archaeon]